VITAPSGGIIAGGADSTFNCAGGLAANPAAGAITFNIVSSKDTNPRTDNIGYTTVATALTWTSAVPTTNVAGEVPSSITFTLGVTDALLDGETITLTSSSPIWSAVGVQNCYSTKHALTAVASTTSTLQLSAHYSGIDAGTLTFTCIGGLAANPASTTQITFSAVSERSITAITTKTGYTIASVSPTSSPTAAPTHSPTWSPTTAPTSSPTVDGPAIAGVVLGSLGLALLVIIAIALGVATLFLLKQMKETHATAITATRSSKANKQFLTSNIGVGQKNTTAPAATEEQVPSHKEVQLNQLDVEEAGLPAMTDDADVESKQPEVALPPTTDDAEAAFPTTDDAEEAALPPMVPEERGAE
jgi:hypothetical protein